MLLSCITFIYFIELSLQVYQENYLRAESVLESNYADGLRPYAALFHVLFNSTDHPTHYPTRHEVKTVLFHNVLQYSPICSGVVDTSIPTRHGDDTTFEEHYRTAVLQMLNKTVPRFIIETNCDHEYESGTGLWGTLLLQKNFKINSADRADYPIIVCADNWYDKFFNFSPNERKRVFLQRLETYELNDHIYSMTLARDTLKWLYEFKWTVDIIHFNDLSCETMWSCIELVQSSWELLRPEGILTAHVRLTHVTTAFQFLVNNGKNAELKQTGLFLLLKKLKNPDEYDHYFDHIENQKQHYKEVANEVRVGHANSPSNCKRRYQDCDSTGTNHHLLSVIKAVNLIESYLDAGRIVELVDIINANYVHVAPLASPDILNIYEGYLLRYFRCHSCYPLPQIRRDHLGSRMASRARYIALSDLSIDKDSIWSLMMSSLLNSQKKRYESFYQYYQLQMNPALFHWEEFPTTNVGGSIFNVLLNHSEYNSWLREVHSAGEYFMFGVVPKKATYEYQGTFYRPGR